MSIDLSRIGTDLRKEYRGIRLQQGRVLTDDDFNEAAVIEAEEVRRTRIDTIGAAGSPDQGFLPLNLTKAGDHIAFQLSAGTLYLGGHRLELRQDLPFDLQNNWLNLNPETAVPVAPSESQTRNDLVWIEAWEQSVSAVEDDELFEVALGGADTGVRTRVMYRVRVATGVGQNACASAWEALLSSFSEEGTLNAEMELATTATLKVSFNTPPQTGDLCSPPLSGGYLGAENQAVRVQMVDATHYVWGYDNASPLYRVRVGPDNQTLTMVTLPKDAAHWPLQGQVVEVLEWSAALPNGQRLAELDGHLRKVSVSYDPNTKTLQLEVPLPELNVHAKARRDHAAYWNGQDDDAYVYLRVWNRGDDLASPAAIPIPVGPTDSNARLGNSGLSVQFMGGPLRKNDYWVIAARPAAPQKLVPWELGGVKGIAAHGIKRYRAPLALIEWLPNDRIRLHDCRPRFSPLSCQHCCMELIARPGPGWEQVFDGIPVRGDAVVCFPAGEYPVDETVIVTGKGRVQMRGAGPATRIVGNAVDVVLQFQDCDGIDMRDLHLSGGNRHEAGLGGTLAFREVHDVALSGISVRCKSGRRRELCCVRIENAFTRPPVTAGRVKVRDCNFYIGHLQIGLLVENAASIRVHGCRFVASGMDVESVQDALREADFRANLARSALVLIPRSAPMAFHLGKINVEGAANIFGADPAAHTFWNNLIVNDKNVGRYSAAQQNMLRRYLVRRLFGILASRNALAEPAISGWLEVINSSSVSAASQAIVVGGRRADHVQIESNEIERAVQGVHIGLSHSTLQRNVAQADFATRVVVRQNKVSCVLCAGAPLERHGVFVGNARSIAILDNYLTLERLPGARHLPVDGIRIFGFPGEMAHVLGNYIGGFTQAVKMGTRGSIPSNPSIVVQNNYPVTGA